MSDSWEAPAERVVRVVARLCICKVFRDTFLDGKQYLCPATYSGRRAALRRSFVITLTLGLLFVCLAVVTPSGAADKPINWKMTSLWTPVIQLIEGDRHFVKLVNTLADGQLKIKFFDGGTLVPPYQVFEAVAKGTIDAGSDSAFIWAGKDTAFGLLGAYPFGLNSHRLHGLDLSRWRI